MNIGVVFYPKQKYLAVPGDFTQIITNMYENSYRCQQKYTGDVAPIGHLCKEITCASLMIVNQMIISMKNTYCCLRKINHDLYLKFPVIAVKLKYMIYTKDFKKFRFMFYVWYKLNYKKINKSYKYQQ